jgi:hypothetical protein
MKVKCKIFISPEKFFEFIGIVRNKRKKENFNYFGIEIWEINEKNRTILYNFIENYLR